VSFKGLKSPHPTLSPKDRAKNRSFKALSSGRGLGEGVK